MTHFQLSDRNMVNIKDIMEENTNLLNYQKAVDQMECEIGFSCDEEYQDIGFVELPALISKLYEENKRLKREVEIQHVFFVDESVKVTELKEEIIMKQDIINGYKRQADDEHIRFLDESVKVAELKEELDELKEELEVDENGCSRGYNKGYEQAEADNS